MEQPLVTVIIPVYNAAPDLARCIESVRKQSYRNLEIFLINDGSTDASGPICHMYGRIDPRIHVIEQENSGVSAARNAGISAARGKYLQFVDSDDYLAPDATAGRARGRRSCRRALLPHRRQKQNVARFFKTAGCDGSEGIRA